MAYFKTCTHCGATLDPGEKCDCKKIYPLFAGTSMTDRYGKFHENSRKNFTITTTVNTERSITNDQTTR